MRPFNDHSPETKTNLLNTSEHKYDMAIKPFTEKDFLLKINLPEPITWESASLDLGNSVVPADLIDTKGVNLPNSLKHIVNYMTDILHTTDISFHSLACTYKQKTDHQESKTLTFIGFILENQITDEKREEVFLLIKHALMRLNGNPNQCDSDDDEMNSTNLKNDIEPIANQFLIDNKVSEIKGNLEFVIAGKSLLLTGKLNGECELEFESQSLTLRAVVVGMLEADGQFKLHNLDGANQKLKMYFEKPYKNQLWKLGHSKEVCLFHLTSRLDGGKKEVWQLVKIEHIDQEDNSAPHNNALRQSSKLRAA